MGCVRVVEGVREVRMGCMRVVRWGACESRAGVCVTR